MNKYKTSESRIIDNNEEFLASGSLNENELIEHLGNIVLWARLGYTIKVRNYRDGAVTIERETINGNISTFSFWKEIKD